MPLIKNLKFGRNVYLGVWKIEESIDELKELYKPFFCEKDIINFHTEKRIAQFLAARLAAKAICEKEAYFEGVIKNSDGAPYLINKNNMHLSLSHSHDYSCAIIYRKGNIGLDMEKYNPKLLKIAPRVFNASEMELFGHDIEKATIAWSAKEAIYKLVQIPGLSFRDSIAIKSLIGKRKLEVKIKGIEKNIVLYYYKGEEYCITVASAE